MENNAQVENVLNKAFTAACEKLGVPKKHILFFAHPKEGPHNVSADQVTQETASDNKVKIVKVYKYLITLTGSDQAASTWLRSPNSAIAGIPLLFLQTQDGLNNILEYLEDEVYR